MIFVGRTRSVSATLGLVSYRDDLAAAHARVTVLERELEHAREEIEQLKRELDALRTDAKLGREAREAHARAVDKEVARKAREEAKAHERALRDKMKRWQREAEDRVRAQERELERKRREAEELAGLRRTTE